jgi:hypothetical protein
VEEEVAGIDCSDCQEGGEIGFRPAVASEDLFELQGFG